MQLKKLLTAIAVFGLLYTGRAQQLDPVYVTETLQKQVLRQTGRNISILTKEDIRKLPVNTLDELLRFVPGIEVQQRGPQGSQSDIIIRGGTFQQVLVVVDGVRLNDPITGHFSAYIPVQPNDIERIEVIKGAAAAVFGPDAVGGVIHVITKKVPDRNATISNHISAGVKAGSYGLFNFNGWVSTEGKGGLISAGYQRNKATGPDLRGTSGFFKNDLLTLQMKTYLSSKWTWAIQMARDSRSFNAQNYYTTFLSDTANEKVGATWMQSNISRAGDKGHLSILLGAKNLKDVYYFRPTTSPNINYSRLYNADIRHTLKIKNSNARFTSGIQYFRKEIRSNDRGDHQLNHVGIYGMMQHSIGDRWFFTESLRGDWDESYQWQLLPQVNIAWVGKQLSFRGSAGKGIRDADFTERYNNYNKALVTGGSIGNPGLTAERSFNWELGMDLFLTRGVQLRTTYFQRNQKDLIDWVTTSYADMPRQVNLSPTGVYALARNLAEVTTRGWELDLGGRHAWSEKGSVRWNTGLLWLESQKPDNTPASFYLASHAKWIWNSSVIVSGRWGVLSFSTLYKKREAQRANSINADISSDYFIMNMRLEKYLMKEKLGLQLQVDNLFDRSYSDLLGSRMPGRWVSGGITVRL